jgi:hypothetical protein
MGDTEKGTTKIQTNQGASLESHNLTLLEEANRSNDAASISSSICRQKGP